MDWPVRLVVRTPGFHPGNRGSIPLRATKAGVAQLVEQGPFKPLVVGSSPSTSTTTIIGETNVKTF